MNKGRGEGRREEEGEEGGRGSSEEKIIMLHYSDNRFLKAPLLR
jgi:hypothetical protein